MKILIVLLTTSLLVACGGGSIAPAHIFTPQAESIASDFPAPHRANRTPRVTTPDPNIVNLAGSWELQFVPALPTSFIAGMPSSNLIEVNLQQSGGNIIADSNQMFLLAQYEQLEYVQGSLCTGLESGSLLGTTSNDSLTFTISLGSSTIQTIATINPDGTLIGSYTDPNEGINGCPFNNSGSFTGVQIIAPLFDGVYVGALLNSETSDVETITLRLQQSNEYLNVVDDNSTFTPLTGNVIGAFFEAQSSDKSFKGYMPLNTANIYVYVWDEISGAKGVLKLNEQ